MLRQIKYFQAVVKHNSFSEAAVSCNISQSAISQQIKALEEELGIELLERKNRKFILTPAGEHFYRKSLVLVADYEQICRETYHIAHNEKQGIKVGYLRSYNGSEFSLALESFADQYPDVEIQVEGGSHEELYQMIRKNELDIVFNDQRRAFSNEYENMVLSVCNSYIEISARNPIANIGQISMKELKNTPCILISSKDEQEEEKEYFQTVVGIQGEILFAENTEEARLLVIAGKGFLLSEGTPVEGSLGTNICRIPLVRGEVAVQRTYCAFWKKQTKKEYVTDFAICLKDRFKQH